MKIKYVYELIFFFKMYNVFMILGCNVCGENYDIECCLEFGFLFAEI